MAWQSTTRVPSIEEFKLRMAARLEGKPMPDPLPEKKEPLPPAPVSVSRQPAASVNDLHQIDRRIEDLRREVKGKAKRTPTELREALGLLMEQYDMEPAEELVRMVAERNAQGGYLLDPDTRIKILMELMQYRIPKLRSVETSGTVNHAHTIVIARFGEDGVLHKERTLPPAPEQKCIEVKVEAS